MAIACPYCKHAIDLKGIKAGKTTPKCPQCAHAFRLTASDDPARPAVAEPLASAGRAVTLGGYRMLKLLGRGGMGAVYLARQLSLDRLVAVKVMLPKAAADPAFVARFTREAHAAARLVHHNVVQIYDVGSERNTPYFSMEYVRGESLMDLVRREGRLDPVRAAGYALQAARGLKYGHDRGVIHRDVKPDNLLLNDQGIVKVADMGLVKLDDAAEAAVGSAGGDAAATPDDGRTRAGFAMGTPSYMAPEQAVNSSAVGPAADVYSLGCTLYVLLTGKPPFEGKTALELLTKHATAPVVRPDAVVKDVPKALSDVLVKMLAKKPEERYADMGAVVAALEDYLGGAAFTPREEHADALERAVRRFNDAPAVKRRRIILLASYGAVALLTVASALIGWTTLAAGFLALGLLTPAFTFLVRGVSRRTPLYLKARELVLGGRPRDWLVWGVGACLFLLFLWLFGLLGAWAVAAVLAAGAAAGIFFGLDRRVDAERAPAIAAAEKLLRNLRLRGLEEADLRRFVSQHSGPRWEEFFEALFGYEAKLAARTDPTREKFAPWREPVVAWIDARLAARKLEHARPVEAPPLAIPLPVATAIPTAVPLGDAITPAAALAPAVVPVTPGAARNPEKLFTLKPRSKTGPGVVASVLGELVGSRTRFLAGALLLGGFFLWLYQNDLLGLDRLLKQAQSLSPFAAAPPKALAPLWLPFIPLDVSQLFGTLSAGAAGAVLLVSGLFESRRLTAAVVPGAAAMVVAPWAPGRLDLPPAAAPALFVAGLLLALLGFLFLRKVRYRGPWAYDE